MRWLVILAAIGVIWAAPAHALIEVSTGNAPVTDRNWPAGSVDLANLKTRIGWWEGPPFGGGRSQFEYRGDTSAFNQALEVFALIKAPRLLLVVNDGAGSFSFTQDPANCRVDWEFAVWDPQSFYALFNDPGGMFSWSQPEFHEDVEAPRMDVYLTPGGIDWSHVVVPPGITVRDERASANGYQPGDGAVVRGIVYDMLTSKPVAGATVLVETFGQDVSGKGQYKQVATGVTDADGSYEIKKLPAGQYRISIQAKGYASRIAGDAKFSADTLKTFDCLLSASQHIHGQVCDTSNKPVANVEVEVQSIVGIDGRGYPQPQEYRARTDDKGQFSIDGLPKGFVQLYAMLKGYQPLNVLTVYRTPGDNVQLQITATGRVSGRVISKPGQPLGNVNVNLEPPGDPIGKWGASLVVQPDGTFNLENVPPGEYFVSTRPFLPGEPPDPHAKTITVVAGKTTTVELNLP